MEPVFLVFKAILQFLKAVLQFTKAVLQLINEAFTTHQCCFTAPSPPAFFYCTMDNDPE